MQTGLDRLLADRALRAPLAGRRVGLLAHPASVTADLTHALDALAALGDLRLTAAFGPQHGLRGDKQDNMIESPDFADPRLGIPVFSLYGTVRRPTDAMMDTFDVLLVDLQDVGTRIYTFVTTLRYVLEAAAAHGKAVWVLDRPNPVGRPIEGPLLRPGWESFVGAGPLPMRHGLTLGELARLVRPPRQPVGRLRSGDDGRVGPRRRAGLGVAARRARVGEPEPERREPVDGARVSRHGHARGHDAVGRTRHHPPARAVRRARPRRATHCIARMNALAPTWLAGCRLRPCWFEPTFHKHVGTLCAGVQIHVEDGSYDHAAFRPWRLVALAFKALRALRPDYPLWRDFPYEYEEGRLAIDLLNGGTALREWVDDPAAEPGDLDRLAAPDETAWIGEREGVLLYR